MLVFKSNEIKDEVSFLGALRVSCRVHLIIIMILFL